MEMKNVKAISIPNPEAVSLPSGYTQKAYIYKSDSRAYIDLGITPTANTNIECTFNYDNSAISSGDYSYLIFGASNGSLSSSTTSLFLSLYKGTNTTNATSLIIGYGDNKRIAYDQFSSGTTYTFRNDGGNVYINGTLNSDLSTASPVFSNNMGNLRIGSAGLINGSVEGKASFEIYRFKVWENGVLIKDLIPCTQSSPFYIGFYDLVSNQFLTPDYNFQSYGDTVEPNKDVKKIENSNGDIIWGSEDAFPYRRLEYIHFNGTDNYLNPAVGTKSGYYRQFIFDLERNDVRQSTFCCYDGTATDTLRRYYAADFDTTNGVRFCCGSKFSTGLALSNIPLNTKLRISVANSTVNSKPRMTFNLVNTSTGSFIISTTTLDGTANGNLTGSTPYLMGCHTTNTNVNRLENPTKGKVYYFEERQSNYQGSFTKRMYPAQRKSDGVCGLYDTVSNSFFPMQGTSVTTQAAGPTVDEYWDLTA